jgi:hypothetical protein
MYFFGSAYFQRARLPREEHKKRVRSGLFVSLERLLAMAVLQ